MAKGLTETKYFRGTKYYRYGDRKLYTHREARSIVSSIHRSGIRAFARSSGTPGGLWAVYTGPEKRF